MTTIQTEWVLGTKWCSIKQLTDIPELDNASKFVTIQEYQPYSSTNSLRLVLSLYYSHIICSHLLILKHESQPYRNLDVLRVISLIFFSLQSTTNHDKC